MPSLSTEPISDASWQATSGRKPGTVPSIHLRPLQLTWEVTRACEWKISPSRLARMLPDREEFSTAEAFHLIQEVATMRVPLLALTGGDPLLRHDLLPIIEFAARRSVRTSLTLVPTPLLTAEIIRDLKACGLMRVGLWLHASTPSLHDSQSGIRGSHRRTLEVIAYCHEADLPVQINTAIAASTSHDIDPMIELLTRLDVALWNVFFQVPKDPDHADELLTAQQHELVFAKLYSAAQQAQFHIKTTEGQHYQRYVLEQRMRDSRSSSNSLDANNRVPTRVNDSRGFVFVNHRGEVYPSRFLPISAGNVIDEPLAGIFRKSALFESLRDTSRLKGKCGRCSFRTVCGGSRARAYAMTRDLFAEDPCCAYQP
jgi:radical SAM protein with 4Fe4S-binding SPASM domain